MIFTRRWKYIIPSSKEELKNRLVGKHVNIHNLDFEVFENENSISIIPHAEQIASIKTLPVTNIFFETVKNGTKITVISKMRQFDSGGPTLILIFCVFEVIASAVLFGVGGNRGIATVLLGFGVAMFLIFWIRMEMGYFDYVRKIRAYIKYHAVEVLNGWNMEMSWQTRTNIKSHN